MCTFCLSPLKAVRPSCWSVCVPCVLSIPCCPLSTQQSSPRCSQKGLSLGVLYYALRNSSARGGGQAAQTTPCLLQDGGGSQTSRGGWELESRREFWRRAVAAEPPPLSPLPPTDALMDSALGMASLQSLFSPPVPKVQLQLLQPFGMVRGDLFFPNRDQPLAAFHF